MSAEHIRYLERLAQSLAALGVATKIYQPTERYGAVLHYHKPGRSWGPHTVNCFEPFYLWRDDDGEFQRNPLIDPEGTARAIARSIQQVDRPTNDAAEI
jgi:hypothetical protein